MNYFVLFFLQQDPLCYSNKNSANTFLIAVISGINGGISSLQKLTLKQPAMSYSLVF